MREVRPLPRPVRQQQCRMPLPMACPEPQQQQSPVPWWEVTIPLTLGATATICTAATIIGQIIHLL